MPHRTHPVPAITNMDLRAFSYHSKGMLGLYDHHLGPKELLRATLEDCWLFINMAFTTVALRALSFPTYRARLKVSHNKVLMV